MKVPNYDWTMSSLNSNHAICDTYPRYIYVPSQASISMLVGSSQLRSDCLPVLTYLHTNKASISRCSQPVDGLTSRCIEDEQMLEAIRDTNPNSKFIYVVGEAEQPQ